MPVDFTSLLLATAFSGAGLSLMMLLSWLSSKKEGFTLTLAIGVLVIVAHVLAYAVYFRSPSPLLFPAMASLLVVGFSIIFAASLQFCHGTNPVRPAAFAAGLSTTAVVIPALWGLDGVALILQNTAAGILLMASGIVYLRSRAQAQTQMVTLFVLYLITATSFWLCGATLLAGGQWVIGHAPDNWAEHLNIVVSVSCLSGAAAISLGLHHSRMARRHEIESLTDPLTGLLNRRALFSIWNRVPLSGTCAVALFDIDHFKQVNDRHGHAAGDEVLAAFGRIIRLFSREHDLAVRIGGEEFALLIPRIVPDQAMSVAEHIRAEFAATAFEAGGEPFSCTVSIGIGWGSAEGASLDEVLGRADRALYAAKDGGRDRIRSAPLRKVG